MTPCALCSHEARFPILAEQQAFCCPGCQAVFSILSSKRALVNFQQHPLFIQAVKAGLISNPALLEQLRQKQASFSHQEREKFYLEITDMWCPSCAEVIKLLLLQEKGVINCVVDYTTDLASIEFSPRDLSKDKIFSLIRSFGYQAASLEDPSKKEVSFSLYLRFIVAAFCSLNIMMFSYPIYASYFDADLTGYAHLFSWLSLVASLPVITFSGYPIYRRFLHSLQVGLFGMESLVVMGVTAAFGLSLYELLSGSDRVYFDSMSVIITLVLLGKIIEAKAKFSAKETLLRLNRALPRRGRKRLEGGTMHFVPLKEVLKGDILVALTGEKVVLDGIVTEGEGLCDESLMTGESWPVPKRPGAHLLAGTIVQQGPFCFQVTKSSDETALHKIIETLEKDLTHKTVYVRSVDFIIRWFVPAVLLISVCTALISWLVGANDPILRAIAVLLISCPCAIGIAVPLAESYLMNRLASMGVIIRNRGCLALLGRETLFVFDKTGTVTEGRFTVLTGLEQLSSEERTILKAITSKSIHPLSKSISEAIQESPCLYETLEEHVGRGLRCTIGADCYLLGSAAFTGTVSSQSTQGIVTTVFFTKNGQQIAVIALGDRIRNEAKSVISEMSQTLLLSGDSPSAVEAVATACGFKEWRAECSPFEKRDCIENLRRDNQLVCMLGDGINDALALAEAHVGISVVSATDISIQVSDILLTTEQLDVIAKMRQIARTGQKIARQNLFWAFFYNVLGLPLAAAGILSPLFAAFAMMASSLIVLFNAKRIK